MSAMPPADPFAARRPRRAPARWKPFAQAGIVASADAHVAALLARLAGGVDEATLLAAALAVRAPRTGHTCVDLATIASRAIGRRGGARRPGDAALAGPCGVGDGGGRRAAGHRRGAARARGLAAVPGPLLARRGPDRRGPPRAPGRGSARGGRGGAGRWARATVRRDGAPARRRGGRGAPPPRHSRRRSRHRQDDHRRPLRRAARRAGARRREAGAAHRSRRAYRQGRGASDRGDRRGARADARRAPSTSARRGGRPAGIDLAPPARVATGLTPAASATTARTGCRTTSS